MYAFAHLVMMQICSLARLLKLLKGCADIVYFLVVMPQGVKLHASGRLLLRQLSGNSFTPTKHVAAAVIAVHCITEYERSIYATSKPGLKF